MRQLSASTPLSVRTPAEMTLCLEVLGHAPFVGDVEHEDGGVVVWRSLAPAGRGETYRFRIESPEAPPDDLGPGTSSVLDPADFHRHAVAIERSVPGVAVSLGALYLNIILERLALAQSCRAQLRRFLPEKEEAIPAACFHAEPADARPFEREAMAAAEARLDALVETMRRARLAVGAPPGPTDVSYAPGTCELSREQAAELPVPPYPADDLKALAANGWGLVESELPKQPTWGLFRHEASGAMLAVRVRDNAEVAEQKLVEGAEALYAFAAHGSRLTVEVGVALLGALPIGIQLADLEARLNALPVRLRQVAEISAGDSRAQRFFAIDQLAPRRRMAVLATVTEGGVLLGRHLLDGPAAIDQIERLAHRRIASEGDAASKAAAALEAIRDDLRARLLPFTEPGADLRALTDTLRPRTGDADKAFVGEAAAQIEKHGEAVWQAEDAPLFGPKPGQTEVTVSVCPAALLGKQGPLGREFPRAMHALAPHLEPARIWASVRFHRRHKPSGVRYDGLVWLGDRWVWFPKPWRLIQP